MATPSATPLVVGLPGTEVDDQTRQILDQVQPAGVILFSRNIQSSEQVRELVTSLQDLETSPFICVDLEGGAVNRLSGLWGSLPSAARAAAAGRRATRALGEAAGAACRCLGIHLDLAPVVDLNCSGGMVGRQRRCLGDDPERVVTLAKLFAEGLGAWCVGGCLKHFPGLGAIADDTHELLPALDLDEAELATHVNVFAQLSESVPVVMMAHLMVPSLCDGKRPASLCSEAVKRAASLPGNPVVLTDDLEMGAVTGIADLPELVIRALQAGNHGVLVCHSFDRLPEITGRIAEATEQDETLQSRVSQLAARLGTLRRDLCRTSASVPAPDDATVAQLWERAWREAEG